MKLSRLPKKFRKFLKKSSKGDFVFMLCIFAMSLYFFCYTILGLNDMGSIIEFPTQKHENYCIAFNVTKATGNFRDDGLEPVSLTVHSTSDYLENLEQLLVNWDGPVSLSIFIDQYSKNVVDYLIRLHSCIEEANKKLNVHIVFEMAPFQTSCDPIIIHPIVGDCYAFSATRRSRDRAAIIPPFQIYPTNVMRNIAREGALSNIHMMADIDMIFSQGFATDIKKLANQYINGIDKNVLVIRRFEVCENQTLPTDHEELQQLHNDSLAFEFREKQSKNNHRIPNLEEWFRNAEKFSEITAWEIEYSGSSWDPLLILHRNDPYNPEYIPTGKKNQQALTYQLCRANYKFNLVSHLFSSHFANNSAGFSHKKLLEKHLRKLWRSAHERFVESMDEKYPDNNEKCGDFLV